MEDIRKLVQRLFLHFPLGEASQSHKISRTFTQHLSAIVLLLSLPEFSTAQHRLLETISKVLTKKPLLDHNVQEFWSGCLFLS